MLVSTVRSPVTRISYIRYCAVYSSFLHAETKQEDNSRDVPIDGSSLSRLHVRVPTGFAEEPTSNRLETPAKPTELLLQQDVPVECEAVTTGRQTATSSAKEPEESAGAIATPSAASLPPPLLLEDEDASAVTRLDKSMRTSEDTIAPLTPAGGEESREPQAVFSKRPSLSAASDRRRRSSQQSVSRRPSNAMSFNLNNRRFSIVSGSSQSIGLVVSSTVELPAVEEPEGFAAASVPREQLPQATGENEAMKPTSAAPDEVSSLEVQRNHRDRRQSLSEVLGYASRPLIGRRVSEGYSNVDNRPKLPARRSSAMASISSNLNLKPREPFGAVMEEAKAEPSDGQTSGHTTQTPIKADTGAQPANAVSEKCGHKSRERKVWFIVSRNAPTYFNFDPLEPAMAELNTFSFDATEEVEFFEYVDEADDLSGGGRPQAVSIQVTTQLEHMTQQAAGDGVRAPNEATKPEESRLVDIQSNSVRKVRAPFPQQLTPIDVTAHNVYREGVGGELLLERLGPHDVSPAPDVRYARKWGRRAPSIPKRFVPRARFTPDASSRTTLRPSGQTNATIDEAGTLPATNTEPRKTPAKSPSNSEKPIAASATPSKGVSMEKQTSLRPPQTPTGSRSNSNERYERTKEYFNTLTL